MKAEIWEGINGEFCTAVCGQAIRHPSKKAAIAHLRKEAKEIEDTIKKFERKEKGK